MIPMNVRTHDSEDDTVDSAGFCERDMRADRAAGLFGAAATSPVPAPLAAGAHLECIIKGLACTHDAVRVSFWNAPVQLRKFGACSKKPLQLWCNAKKILSDLRNPNLSESELPPLIQLGKRTWSASHGRYMFTGSSSQK